MNQELKAHYKKLFEEHGDDSAAVQYADQASHEKRFEVLSGVAENMESVLDVGCGLAHLYKYLRGQGFEGRYCGIDFVPEMLAHCRETYADGERIKFVECDISKDDFPAGYDYVILSGVFNNKIADNKSFMETVLRKMWAVAEKGIAFNAITTYVDFQVDELYYADPLEVFHFCKTELGRKIILRNDYLVKANSIPFEYTVYVYK